MRILITGGAGFIGSHIVNALYKKHEVIVLDNLRTGSIDNIKPFIKKILFIKGNILNNKDLEKAGNIDIIFHEAAIPSVIETINDPFNTSNVNIMGTLNVLEYARKHDAKVILASSSAIYGDNKRSPKTERMHYKPKSPYGLAKATNEMFAKLYYELYRLETICLRYFNVYGPNQSINSGYAAVIPKFITLMLNNKRPIIYGDGKQTRDFIYVKDVVQANIKAMQSKKALGKAINIASGKSISILMLVNTLNKLLNKNLKPIFKKERKGDIKHSLADISLAKSLINWEPKVSIKQGLKKTIKWYKNKNFNQYS